MPERSSNSDGSASADSLEFQNFVPKNDDESTKVRGSQFVVQNTMSILITFPSRNDVGVGCVVPYDALPCELIGALEKRNAPYGIKGRNPLARLY
jgi:hypothetical protein